MLTEIVLSPSDELTASVPDVPPESQLTRTKESIPPPPAQVPPESTSVPPVTQTRTVEPACHWPVIVYTYTGPAITH